MTESSPAPLQLYFDFISPYAYLAWTQVHALAARHGRPVQPVPVLFAALLDANGQKGPAEIPRKRVWVFKDTLRHAHASRVEVRLERVKGGVLVSVSDDGDGFSFDGTEQSAPGTLGLAAMRERVELAGGWFHIDTAPDAGVAISLWVPDETVAAERGGTDGV